MSKREMFSKYREYSFMTFLGGLFEIKFYNVFENLIKKCQKGKCSQNIKNIPL
jgi:hypothetical protein